MLLDPAECGPVTLALPQDVQAEAYDYPVSFFEPRVHSPTRPGASAGKLRSGGDANRPGEAAAHHRGWRRSLLGRCRAARASSRSRHHIPVAETQAGKGALPFDHPMNVGAIGVTGSSAANELARKADLIIALGSRLQDFTTASQFAVLRSRGGDLISVNVCRLDAVKNDGLALQGDVARTLQELEALMGEPRRSWRLDGER